MSDHRRHILLSANFVKFRLDCIGKASDTIGKPASIERRSDQDRRQSHISFFKPVLCRGKRYSLRRADDSKQITVLDQDDTSLMIFVLIVLGLSMVDAVLTLILLEHGAVEVNPVMRYCIDLGLGPFVIAKYSLTARPLVVMVMLSASSFCDPVLDHSCFSSPD